MIHFPVYNNLDLLNCIDSLCIFEVEQSQKLKS